MKIQLSTASAVISAANGNASADASADAITIDADRILANDVVFDGEYNPHNVRLWLISNEVGVVAAVWASCMGDALDIAVDADLMRGFAIEERDADEDTPRLGNAGEPFDLTYCSVRQLPQADMPLPLLLAFAEARGAGAAGVTVTVTGTARLAEGGK